MSKILILFLLAASLFAAGCASDDPGSREFIPGRGWVPTGN